MGKLLNLTTNVTHILLDEKYFNTVRNNISTRILDGKIEKYPNDFKAYTTCKSTGNDLPDIIRLRLHLVDYGEKFILIETLNSTKISLIRVRETLEGFLEDVIEMDFIIIIKKTHSL
jgi:hypothetical protein